VILHAGKKRIRKKSRFKQLYISEKARANTKNQISLWYEKIISKLDLSQAKIN